MPLTRNSESDSARSKQLVRRTGRTPSRSPVRKNEKYNDGGVLGALRSPHPRWQAGAGRSSRSRQQQDRQQQDRQQQDNNGQASPVDSAQFPALAGPGCDDKSAAVASPPYKTRQYLRQKQQRYADSGPNETANSKFAAPWPPSSQRRPRRSAARVDRSVSEEAPNDGRLSSGGNKSRHGTPNKKRTSSISSNQSTPSSSNSSTVENNPSVYNWHNFSFSNHLHSPAELGQHTGSTNSRSRSRHSSASSNKSELSVLSELSGSRNWADMCIEDDELRPMLATELEAFQALIRRKLASGQRKYEQYVKEDGSLLIETSLDTLLLRQKQINNGKNRAEYSRYLEAVPHNLRTRMHPRTPNKYQKVSRRNFDAQVKEWRKALHLWDPAPEDLQAKSSRPNVSIEGIGSLPSDEAAECPSSDGQQPAGSAESSFTSWRAAAVAATEGSATLTAPADDDDDAPLFGLTLPPDHSTGLTSHMREDLLNSPSRKRKEPPVNMDHSPAKRITRSIFKDLHQP